MDELEKIYNSLQTKENQKEIGSIVDETNDMLAETISFKKYREYPTGDQYYIDYLENDFDEDKGENQFYADVAEAIKDFILSKEENKIIEQEKIGDIELCQDYADAYFDVETIVDRAYQLSCTS